MEREGDAREREATDAGGERSPAASGAPLLGRRVELRPVRQQDYGFLYEMSVSRELGWRWRHRGATPSPEQFGQVLWQFVLAQFIVEHRESRRPIGLVAAYNAQFQHGFAYVAAMLSPAFKGAPWRLEGLALFLEYLFHTWNFRKLYFETVEFNYDQFRSGLGKYFFEEARLVDHEFYEGRYWNCYILSVWRDRWREHWRRLAPLIVGVDDPLEWIPPAGWTVDDRGRAKRA